MIMNKINGIGMNSKPTLGVVAISYNEEEDLPGFLDNLLPWVDEIVIVDDGSVDSTASIAAAKKNVCFLVSPRSDGEFYSHQRNKGIAESTSDWLLHMDIDERVPVELAKEILSAIRNPDYDAYRYRRLNYFLHRPMRGGGWQDWNLIHLARRDFFHFEGMFHEKCIVDVPAGRVGQLKYKMHHLNDRSFKERIKKSENYLVEVVADIKRQGGAVAGIDIVFNPFVEFLKKFFYKKGFLDGTAGIVSALHSATAVFRAYSVVWDEQNRVSRSEIEQKIESDWRKNGMGTL